LAKNNHVFFLHVILQAVYLVSLTIMALGFLRYQVHVVAWMLATKRPIRIIPGRLGFLWATSLTLLFLSGLWLLNYIGWDWLAAEVRYLAPVMILAAVWQEANQEHIAEFDNLNGLLWNEVDSTHS
jgi:hypothetical protein